MPQPDYFHFSVQMIFMRKYSEWGQRAPIKTTRQRRHADGRVYFVYSFYAVLVSDDVIVTTARLFSGFK